MGGAGLGKHRLSLCLTRGLREPPFCAILERFSRVACGELPWCLGARASLVSLGRNPSHLDSCAVWLTRAPLR